MGKPRNSKPDISLIRAVLDYDPDSGIFTWKAPKTARVMGCRAGHLKPTGYRVLRLFNKTYQESHIAWLWCTGGWPPEEIDHINCVRDDNRICNLREATRSQNQRNRRTRFNSRSGMKGVYPNAGGWQAYITVSGRRINLGCYVTKEEASAAYMGAARVLAKEFARSA